MMRTRPRCCEATITNCGDRAVVTLTGELDEEAAGLLADILMWLDRDGHHLITVQLGHRYRPPGNPD